MEFLNPKKTSGGGGGASTQKYVDVDEIKDGVIILKNGTLRAVLLVSSINFDLKSTEEQDVIINQYQGFLNSVDFPIQILISSKKINLEPYLEFLKDKEQHQMNELLRLQISEYRNFIKNLADVSNIMSKFFYIVVPFAPVENKEGGVFNKIFSIFNPKQVVMKKNEVFETFKNQLWQRVDHVIAGLSGVGVQIKPLKTEELIELLYNSYNPNIFTTTMIKNVEKIELD